MFHLMGSFGRIIGDMPYCVSDGGKPARYALAVGDLKRTVLMFVPSARRFGLSGVLIQRTGTTYDDAVLVRGFEFHAGAVLEITSEAPCCTGFPKSPRFRWLGRGRRGWCRCGKIKVWIGSRALRTHRSGWRPGQEGLGWCPPDTTSKEVEELEPPATDAKGCAFDRRARYLVQTGPLDGGKSPITGVPLVVTKWGVNSVPDSS